MDEHIKKNQLDDFLPEQEVKIPNLLIASKYKATLSENRAMAVSIAKAYYDDNLKRHVAVLDKNDLEKVMINTHAKKKQALLIAQHLTGRDIIVENEDQDTFTVMNFIGMCHYEKGELKIFFEPNASSILAAEKDKTRMHLETILSFKSSYTYRLYEYLLLKTNQLIAAGQYEGPYEIEIELNRLKLTIGLVEITKSVKDDLLKGTKPEEVVENAEIQLFKNWSDFRRYALEVSIKEINAGTSLSVTYDTTNVKGSRAVGSITFHVQVDNSFETNDVIKSEETEPNEIKINKDVSVVPKKISSGMPSRDQILAADSELQGIISDLSAGERVKLLTCANYDIDLIREIYTRSIIEFVKPEETFSWMVQTLMNEV